ncbi:M24 family metallopeptidase [Rubritalea tangerina]|uniref:M24 family metallopeptidase n=2 Tax=Rubritalea tangerina TaxID=430798 RepID=A0ABW4ZDD4_9BACT
MPNSAYLLYSITEVEPNGYYFSQFKSMDPICMFGTFDAPIALIHRMEVERAKQEGRFSKVLDLKLYQERAEKELGAPTLSNAIFLAAKDCGFTNFTIPHDFPAQLFSDLTQLGIKLEIAKAPLFPQRAIKSPQEIEQCRTGAAISEAGFARVKQILQQSSISADDSLIYEGQTLTCEFLRKEIRVACTMAGGGQNSPIAASGPQAADCHCIGFGPVKAHEMIVVDIFPRDDASYMYGDLSRTFVKGTPSDKMRDIYDTVYQAHQAALACFGPGKPLGAVDKAARAVLEQRGYPTRLREDGLWEGCYCGIGHGVGLEVHEFPFIRETDETMEVGQVITIEPGLYIPEVGGCRIEDTIVITKEGYEFINTPNYDWIIE